jgi:regulator of protease activity HflC (stomatin/prohibitin superfamily)
VADVAGQEIMTADKVTLRVNLLVTYVVADVVKAVTSVGDYAQSLYREAQLALRAAVGTRTLDSLLSDKESVGGEVREALSKRTSEIGVQVRGVGLRDIVLPGDMKLILNQVIAATKEAEANLIKRREETAAARSQANTAKLLAESPALARLKELELLKDVLAGAKTTFVFGPGDIADQVRGLMTTEKDV